MQNKGLPFSTKSPSDTNILGFNPIKSVPFTAMNLGCWPSEISCIGDPSIGISKPRLSEKFAIFYNDS